MNDRLARMAAGGERPRPFAATTVYPMYMYIRRQEINKENRDSFVLSIRVGPSYFIHNTFIST
jgi:hypothetical protein